MPPTLTYPGVYIVEAPSGVHTITGVATSIAAFFGQASMGRLNTPIQCLSYSDYTRNLGAPVPGANLAQSVQEFFSNGGSECYVVRLANGAAAAQVILCDLSGTQVLHLSASSPGIWGAGLSVTVDYNTPKPDSTFNLQVTYSSGGTVAQTESFSNLSMDPVSPRYAPTFIQQSSVLLTASAPSLPSGIHGYSEVRGFPPTATGGWVAAVNTNWPTSIVGAGNFQISVDGGSWTPVALAKADFAGATTDNDVFTAIANKINGALGYPGSNYGVTVSASDSVNGFLKITSAATTGTMNSVEIRPMTPDDLAQPLMMGVNQGGIEVSRYSDRRPVSTGICFDPVPSGEVRSIMDGLAAAALGDISKIAINGGTPQNISFTGGPAFYQGSGGATDFDGVRENLQAIANVINANFPVFQAVVAGYRLFIQNLKPTSPLQIDTVSFTVSGPSATAFNSGFYTNVATYPLGLTTSSSTYHAVTPPPSDGNPPAQSDYTGIELNRTGFWALDAVDIFNLMVIPGDGISTSGEWDVIRAAGAQYCHSRRAFLILDAPAEWSINSLSNAQSIVQTFRSPLGNSDINCAVYFPRVQVNDNGILRYVGPSGMIAGMYAITDAARGVWKAPAGTQAALNGVLDLEVILTDKQNGILNPLAVNCLRRMPAGYLIWGARTLAGFDNSGDSAWTYVPVRRMALFLEESLYRGTQWVVFEPNDEPLWAQIRMNIGAFMMGLFRQGAFQGATPNQAFFVKCDSETTTQADIDQGIVNIIVGFAPLKPAEFVIITIQQIAGDLT
jgi:uncharacterized protein